MMTSSNGNIFALLTFCAGNSPVTGEFPSQRPATRSFDISLVCAWTNGWVNSHDADDLRRLRTHYDVTVMARLGVYSILTGPSTAVLSRSILNFRAIVQIKTYISLLRDSTQILQDPSVNRDPGVWWTQSTSEEDLNLGDVITNADMGNLGG